MIWLSLSLALYKYTYVHCFFMPSISPIIDVVGGVGAQKKIYDREHNWPEKILSSKSKHRLFSWHNNNMSELLIKATFFSKLLSSQNTVLIKSIFQPKGCQWLVLGMQPIPLYLRFHVQNFFNCQTSVFPLKSLNFLLSPQPFSFHVCFKIAHALSLNLFWL